MGVIDSLSAGYRFTVRRPWLLAIPVLRGALCTVIGRTAHEEWLLLACPGLTGWVRAPCAQVEGALATVAIVPVEPPDTASGRKAQRESIQRGAAA